MNVDNSKELPTVISFCAGYGGIERGLELAGIAHRVLAYVEIEAFAIANLVAKMEQGELVPAPIYTDLKTFPSDLFRDSVDIITGGYPCQPFSVAGRAQAFDDPRHLFPYILDHVRTIRPSQCFFENVEGHINRGLESVLQDLEGAGYDSTWGIFSAEEVGAPHQRKRIFILANSSGAGRQQVSRSTHENESEHEGRSTAQTDITSSHGEGNRERFMANSDSSRQLQSQGSESEQWGWTGDSGQEGTMADPDSDDRGDRSRTLPRERWPWLEHRSGSERQLVGQPEEELANTINERSQGGLQGRQDSQWEGEHGHTGCGSSAHRQPSSDIWNFEPELGRVAHGIKNRVDRLRLLGNGVVPQTAARAWEVLNGRV
jgi:DNA (cytosine-5)-methyltransferase 1